MTIQVAAKVENPDDTLLTLVITMPVRNWKQLDKQLPVTYPALDVAQAITKAINAVMTAHVANVTVAP